MSRRGKNRCDRSPAHVESPQPPEAGATAQGGTVHEPVLLADVLAGLAVRPGGRYIDCTVGGGGHAEAILRAGDPDAQLLGLDADPAAIGRVRERLAPFGSRVQLVQANFRQVAAVARARGFAPVDGVLFDFGLSSDQLELAGRGFTFQQNEPLDMRFDPRGETTAADLVNELTPEELANVIYDFGEETRSRRIARAIVEARPLETTGQLVEAVERAVGPGGRRHSATRVFQALRIAVNEEIETIQYVLPHALDLLAKGGRLVTISFHSLEDRVVKEFLRREALGQPRVERPSRPGRAERAEHVTRAPQAHLPLPEVAPAAPRVKLVTRKVIMASAAEQQRNPRSRSARLRVAERG